MYASKTDAVKLCIRLRGSGIFWRKDSHRWSGRRPAVCIVRTDLFYTGRFDFVVYERITGTTELPVLAIELDGKEHLEDEAVRRRDAKKNAICREHGFELIRVDNSYARRYHYIKDILIGYFTGK